VFSNACFRYSVFMHVIAIYARASSDRSLRRISVDRQVEQCTDKAKELFPGMEISTFIDNDKSASDPTVERPQYNALIAAIRRGEVKELVVHQQSRLSRQGAGDWDQLVVTLTKAGIEKVHTVLNGTVAVDPGNRLLGRIMSVIDQEESERTKARMSAAHELRAQQGRPAGPAPYGYVSRLGEDRRPEWVIDEPEARVVRLIADRLVAGYSLNAIRDELDDAGEAPPRGARWHGHTVRAVVSTPSVAGLRQYRGEVVGAARWPAIVPPEHWSKVMRALGSATVTDAAGKTYSVERKRQRKGRRWLLSGGLIRCGRCGGQMGVALTTALKNQAQPHMYRCVSRAIMPDNCGSTCVSPAAVVEAIVVEAVLRELDDPRMARRLLEHPDPERAALLAELADVTETMRTAARLWGAGDLDEATFREFHDPAKARADAARARLAALPEADIELPTVELVRSGWDDLPLAQRRAFLERFVERVVVLPAASTGRSKLSEKERVAARLDIVWRH
jgi:site-specific DNA recombinase